MKVYGSSLSPFVRKVLAVIAEKGLVTEHLPLRFQDPSPEFRAASPIGKIPAFADGDYKLADSSAICHYLERKYPAPALFPVNAQDYGRMIWFDEYGDTILVPAAGKVFFNLVVRPNVLGEPPDMAMVETALKTDLPPIFDYLETQISGPFLVGGKLSLADIAIACPFVNLKIAKHPLDVARWPKLGAYVAALHARPSFQAINDQKKAA